MSESEYPTRTTRGNSALNEIPPATHSLPSLAVVPGCLATLTASRSLATALFGGALARGLLGCALGQTQSVDGRTKVIAIPAEGGQQEKNETW